jgi:Tol biopolymer transport system component
MHVLLALVNASGKVLSRDDIVLQVWGVEFATDDLLSRAISDLRKALGDDPKAPAYIETIPTVGYRLIAPVGPREPGDEDAERRPSRSVVGFATVAGAALLLLSVAGAGTIISRGAKPPPQPRPLLSAPGIEVTPEFSPDGQRIVYTWHGPDHAQHDLFVTTVGTPSTPERLAEGPAFSPTWSPDGARIAFVRHSMQSGECSIRVIELAGGPETELVECSGKVQKLRWSPDGMWLVAAITPERGAAAALFRISLNGQGITQLTTPPDSTAGDNFPAFSPDGRFLAFARWTRTESAKLVTLDIESEEVRCLGPDDADIHGVDWAPDGRGILFAARLGSRNGIWEMPRGGGEPQWVAGGELAPHMLDVNPVSGALAYTAIVRERNIWRYAVELDSHALTDPTQVVSSTRVDYRPRLSPDGDQLAFVSNRTGEFELWLSDADGNDAVQLTTLGAHRIGPLQWSHDGSRITFSAELSVNQDVHVLEVATRRVIRRTTHLAGDQLPSWSSDDRWIYFGSERSGDWEIWRMPADSGEAIPVTRSGGYGAVEGPDGQLYFTKWGVDGLWRMRPGESDAELVVDSMPYTPPGNWVLDDGGVIFAAQATAEMQMNIMRHDFASDETQTLAVIGVDPWRTTGLDLSSDGRHLYFTQLDRLEGDLMIVDPR